MSTAAPITATRRRTIFGWALWDWGTSAFSVIITTFVFPLYIVNELFLNKSGYPNTEGDLSSGFQWSFVVAGFIVAIAAPIIGQRADASGGLRAWLATNTIVVGVATIGLAAIAPNPSFWIIGLILYVVANVFYEFAFVNYNTVLVRITTSKNIGRVSGFGWGLGYIGGIVALLVVLVLFIGLSGETGLLGITPDNALNVRLSFAFAGVWAILFALPVFFIAPKKPAGSARKKLSIFASYGKLFKDIARLYREDLPTFSFLIASAIFRDGLAAVFTLGAVIAATVFGFDFTSIMFFGIAANIVGGIGVFIGGALEDKFGPKAIIMVSLCGLIVAGLFVFFFRDMGQITFWIGGLLLSLFVGPTQSSSRSFLGRLTKPGKEGELYGLYATTGRGLSWLTGLLFAVMAGLLGGDAFGILAIVFVLLIGLLLMIPIRPQFNAKR
jgi:UMF1 family MFS transporter